MHEVEYLNDDKTLLAVDYGAKRKAKYHFINFDKYTDEQFYFIRAVYSMIIDEVNMSTFFKLEKQKRFSLVEKYTRRACGLYSPRQIYDISKAEVRAIIYTLLTEVIPNH